MISAARLSAGGALAPENFLALYITVGEQTTCCSLLLLVFFLILVYSTSRRKIGLMPSESITSKNEPLLAAPIASASAQSGGIAAIHRILLEHMLKSAVEKKTSNSR